MKNKKNILRITLILVLIASISHAAIIKVEVVAQIESIMDDADILGGTVSVGDQINGWYAYDTSVSPSVIENNAALYVFTAVPCGIFLSVDGFNFETDLNNIDFQVGVGNNNYGNADHFTLSSRNNVMVSGMPIDRIHIQFNDDTASAFDSYELPTQAPALSEWSSYHYLGINGSRYVDTMKQYFEVSATVTSAVLIPEPMTLLLLAVGSMVIRFRKK